MANRTKAQLKAIETQNKTLLVSAAAGSGKTTVLIERIIRMLTDPQSPADISRMLIVTFTRAAASELRQRISSALSSAIADAPGDKRLFKQLASLGSAHISTIDSFYGDVVRRHSQKLGIPSNLRIADDTELISLQRSVMDDVIDSAYDGDLFDRTEVTTEDFTKFADSISDMRNDSEMCDVFTDLREKLSSHPRSTEFLLECGEMYGSAVVSDLFLTPHGKVIKAHVEEQMELLIGMLTEACEYFGKEGNKTGGYFPAFRSDLEFCLDISESIKNEPYSVIKDKFRSYSPLRLSGVKKEDKTPESDRFCDIRTNTIKETIKKLTATYFSTGCSEEELVSFAASSKKNCIILYRILNEFENRYSEEKLSKGICEFNDVKQWAYSLLVSSDGSPTDIANEISESFDSIYIDEYQDVDPVQDLIFRAISKPCGRFMVGDVKQSIYSFRGAEPTLFMNYRSSFSQIDPTSEALPDDDNCTIFMSENFRCDRSVVDFSNKVCSHIFSHGSRSINYSLEDDLVFSKISPSEGIGSPVTVAIIERSEEAPQTVFKNAEAGYVASEIDRLIRSGKKSDGSPIAPGDIAVLSRSASGYEKVAEALDMFGIAYTGGGGTSIFDDPEVSLTVSLLHTIDNPQRDVHMASALISPVFGFTADDLITVRERFSKCSVYDAICAYREEENDELAKKCADTVRTLEELRTTSVSLSADKIIQHVFSHFSLLSRDGGEKSSRAALLRLYEDARSFEGDEFKGLYSYLIHVENMILSGKAPSVDSADAPDSVKLMTIHKSKGLEFPVCFVVGCASPFNRDDSKDLLLYSSRLGIAMDLMDDSGFGKIRTPYRRALARSICDTATEEEMRVFYVALTRAREKLYVTAMPRGSADKLISDSETKHRYPCRASILNSSNYISWVLTALGNEEHESYRIIRVDETELTTPKAALKESADGAGTTESTIRFNAEIYDKIRSDFEFEYPYLHVSNIPAKLSVSKLSPDVLDRSSDTEEGGTDSIDIALPEICVSPSFMSDSDSSKLSAAEKGTATHTFLQFCDFDQVINHGVKAELDRLLGDRFIDKRYADAVNIRQLERFFESDLFKEISSARRVWREQRFNILLSASDFTEDDDYARMIKDEKLLVQGVMDLFFESEDGRFILCDYKTDFLTREELCDPSLAKKKLSERHAKQLSYYAEALKAMFGKAPDKILIYSLPLGNTVEVEI